MRVGRQCLLPSSRWLRPCASHSILSYSQTVQSVVVAFPDEIAPVLTHLSPVRCGCTYSPALVCLFSLTEYCSLSPIYSILVHSWPSSAAGFSSFWVFSVLQAKRLLSSGFKTTSESHRASLLR